VSGPDNLAVGERFSLRSLTKVSHTQALLDKLIVCGEKMNTKRRSKHQYDCIGVWESSTLDKRLSVLTGLVTFWKHASGK